MDWRNKPGLWNGVVNVRPNAGSEDESGFVSFFVSAASKEAAAGKLYMELLDRGWTLVSFLNFQPVNEIDDEAAGRLNSMALEGERDGVSFSDFPQRAGHA